jgi:hypothetical protein
MVIAYPPPCYYPVAPTYVSGSVLTIRANTSNMTWCNRTVAGEEDIRFLHSLHRRLVNSVHYSHQNTHSMCTIFLTIIADHTEGMCFDVLIVRASG